MEWLQFCHKQYEKISQYWTIVKMIHIISLRNAYLRPHSKFWHGSATQILPSTQSSTPYSTRSSEKLSSDSSLKIPGSAALPLYQGVTYILSQFPLVYFSCLFVMARRVFAWPNAKTSLHPTTLFHYQPRSGMVWRCTVGQSVCSSDCQQKYVLSSA